MEYKSKNIHIGKVERVKMLNLKTVNFIFSKITSLPLEMNEKKIMEQIVNIICEQLNLYFVGLFSVDSTQESLILRAGSGKIGQELVSQKWTIALTDRNFWTSCILLNEVRLNNWTKQEAFGASLSSVTQTDSVLALEPRDKTFPGPLLPGTSWQLLLPLRLERKVVGILEIQSSDPTADFNAEDVTNFLLLADYIATSLSH